ncbi:MAG: N-acetyl-gamma-glutamyl-phosphate reductase [Bacillota bacterium]|nr:N-acetyl-gamma-glutamyl-phosphate reductase [Bacillota bacterium]
MEEVRVGIVGASGYTGGELLRLLVGHPQVEVAAVTSRSLAGRLVGEAFPSLGASYPRLAFAPTDSPEAVAGCDVVFLTVPSGVAMTLAPPLLAAGARVIDLGADFRFREAAVYAAWYGQPHACPDLLAEAVYGLPEFFREEIRKARLVGNPGCYPTAAALAVWPALEAGLAEPEGLIVDAKSGVSGAGRHPALEYHFPEVAENLRAYKVAGHRHTPEIEQLVAVAAGQPAAVTFTPHLIPMNRGMLVTAYLRLRPGVEPAEVAETYRRRYAGEPMISFLEGDALPQTKAVAGSNRVDVAVRVDTRTRRLVALAALDNLVKGAAGQAVQNLNVLCGFPETTGLPLAGLWP